MSDEQPQKKRRAGKADTQDKREVGILRALELASGKLSRVDQRDILVKEFGCALRTAYKWLNEAQAQIDDNKMRIPEPAQKGLYTIQDALKNPGDVNGHRWLRVEQYLSDIAQWREVRDQYLEAHNRATNNEQRNAAIKNLKVADARLISWEHLLCEVLHFKIVAPDRGLSDASVRGLIVTELARNINVLTFEECELLRSAIDEAIGQGDGQQQANIDEVLPH